MINVDAAFETLLAYTPSNKKDRIQAQAEVMKKALADNEIFNARYEDMKFIINRAVENAAEGFLMKGNPVSSTVTEMWHVVYRSDAFVRGTTNISTAQKRSAKAGMTEYSEFLTNLLPIADAMKYLKTVAIKRQPKPKEDTVEEFIAQFKTESAKAVYEKFKVITASVREQMIDSLDRHYSIQVKFIVEKIQSNKNEFRDFTRNAIDRTAVAKVYDIDYQNKTFTLRANGDAQLLAWVTEQVDQILESYIIKNTKKLAAIIEKKNLKGNMTLLSIQESGMGFNSEMEFKFIDGSSFRVNNQVVYGSNQFGTNFVRFPTTFHDVVNSDGSKMKMPSEKKMNEEFK